MVPSSAGAVVLVPFPFSDLSQSKLRPAIVLAGAGRDDWVLCQVTSKPYGDSVAVVIDRGDFARGSLRIQTFARPGKPLTANSLLFTDEVAVLTNVAFEKVLTAVLRVLKP